MNGQESWGAAPSLSMWYGEVVCGRPGETNYFYGYADTEEPPDPLNLVPAGWTVLETLVRPTAGNAAHFLWDDTKDGERFCYMHPAQDGSPTQNCGTCAWDRGE